jgi:hypothetical protein
MLPFLWRPTKAWSLLNGPDQWQVSETIRQIGSRFPNWSWKAHGWCQRCPNLRTVSLRNRGKSCIREICSHQQRYLPDKSLCQNDNQYRMCLKMRILAAPRDRMKKILCQANRQNVLGASKAMGITRRAKEIWGSKRYKKLLRRVWSNSSTLLIDRWWWLRSTDNQSTRSRL